MSKRSKKKNKSSLPGEEPIIIKAFIQKSKEEDIKLLVMGHEAITEETMRVVERLGNELLLLPEVEENIPIYREHSIPLIRVVLQKDDILLQTHYDLSGNSNLNILQKEIYSLIIKDINNYIRDQMNNALNEVINEKAL